MGWLKRCGHPPLAANVLPLLEGALAPVAEDASREEVPVVVRATTSAGVAMLDLPCAARMRVARESDVVGVVHLLATDVAVPSGLVVDVGQFFFRIHALTEGRAFK